VPDGEDANEAEGEVENILDANAEPQGEVEVVGEVEVADFDDYENFLATVM